MKMNWFYMSAVVLTLFLQESCGKCISEIDAEIQATLSQIQSYKDRVNQLKEA